MKIGVITELLGGKFLDTIDVAGKLGVSGIQIYAAHGDDGFNFLNLKPGELKSIKSKAEDNQLEISAVCADISDKSFQVISECSERVDVTCRVIDAAVKLGVSIITTHIGAVPESQQDPVYPVMVESLRQVANYAASAKCVMAIETGPELADVLKAFIQAVDSPGIGVNLDPANLRGVSCENPVYAAETLAPYIVHTHAKDAINTYVGSPAKFYKLRNLDGSLRQIAARASGFKEVPLGQGMVEWDAYLAALKKIGYNGFLTIERECGADPAADIRMAVAFLKDKLGNL
ncbi:MAG: sugar phosphate isomerase/epimerase [Victivallaceae bacterium]|nr:sugar phosphate isomerase/epimerase [Victivallaceae bacterium]